MIVIADIRPEVGGSRTVQLIIPHRDGGVVRAQHFRLQHERHDQSVQRLSQLGTSGHPVALRAAGDVQSVPAGHILQPVQRKMFRELGGRDEGQHARSRQPLVNRLRRLGSRDHVGLAGFVLAGVDAANVLIHVTRRGLIVRLFTDLFADLVPQLPATRAATFSSSSS